MDSMDIKSLSSREKEEVIRQLEHEFAAANFQELFQNVVEKCFKKCVYKPGVSLSNSEKKCLTMCMDRFLESYELVTMTYVGRIKGEQMEV